MCMRELVMAVSLSTLHVACSDPQRELVIGGPLVAVAEGEVVVLDVTADGLALEGAPPWLTLSDGALTIAPPCDVVPGADGTVAFELDVTGDGVVEPLHVIVAGSRTSGCAPLIAAWSIGDGETCGAVPAIGLDRVCVDAQDLACAGAPGVVAPATLCIGVDTLDPDLEVYAATGSTVPTTLLAAATVPEDRFAAASWGYRLQDSPAVVGVFELEVELFDAPPMPGDEPVASRALPVQAGDPGDAFVAVRHAVPVVVKELGVVAFELRPYAFDLAGPATLRVQRVGASLAPRTKAMMQLRDPLTGVAVQCTETTPCELTADSFELSVSPPFDSAPAELVRIEWVTDAAAIVLDAAPGDPATTDLAFEIRNTGDDRALVDHPTGIACVTGGGDATTQLLVTSATSAKLYTGWPIDSGTTLPAVPRRAIGVLRDAGTGVEAVIVGVFDTTPHVRELIDGVWMPAAGAGSNAPSTAGELSVGTLHPPNSTAATHVVYLGANGQLQLRCIAQASDCQSLPSQVVVGAVVSSTMRDVEGARLEIDPAAGDDLVLTRVEAGSPQVCRISIAWPGTVSAPSCHRVTLGGVAITGGSFGLLSRPFLGSADAVGVRLGVPDNLAVYSVTNELQTAAAGEDVEVTQPSSQPGNPAGMAPDRLFQSLLVATRFGVYERVGNDDGLQERDPIRLEAGDAGELAIQASRDYGSLLTTCVRRPGAPRRAAWLVSGDPADPGAEPRVVRVSNLEASVAGPWPAPDVE